jgi:flagellar biosynthesis/type III secretory pathway protein FliH
MVVRLHWPDLDVDLELSDGIVSRDEAPALLGMDAAVLQVLQEAQTLLTRAQAQAEAWIEEADQEVQAKQKRTAHDARAAAKLGYAQGKEQALAHWLAQALERQKQVQLSYQSQRDYLVHCVVEAVRNMVLCHTAIDFFAAALSSLDAVVEKDNAVVMHVHPQDESAAQEALVHARSRWSSAFSVRVEVDCTLTPRSCRIETATEFVDASLDAQLRALRRRLPTQVIEPLQL